MVTIYIIIVCMALSSVCYLCMSMGVTFTWPSSTVLLFGSDNTTLHRPMTGTELSLFGSLSCIGALISTPAAGFLLDIIGRKYCATLFSIMHVIAWTMIIFSNRVEVLLTAIFISGVGGAAFLVVPLYVNEFCQESIRGAMTTGSMIFYAVGMIISYAIGGYMDYYPMLYVSLSIAVVGIVMLSFLKESPMYLMKRGREEEAAKSMAFYRAAKVDSKVVQQEMDTMRRILNATNVDDKDMPEEENKLQPTKSVQNKKLTLFQFMKQSYSTRRALCVAMVLMTASVFQGLVAVQVYAVPLFTDAIPSMSPTISSIILSIVTLSAGFLAACLTDLLGRRPLLIYSSIASGVCCVLLGSQLQLNWGPVAVTGVIIYSFCVAFTLGAGTIPFVLSAELFLPEVKSVITMLVIEWAWLCSFTMLFIFYPLVAAIGIGPVFYTFAVVCFATAMFTYWFLPETKGLPVDVIQTLFSKKKHRVPHP